MAPPDGKPGVLARIRRLLGETAGPAPRLLESEPDAAFPDRPDPEFDFATTPAWLHARARPFRSCVLIGPPGDAPAGAVRAGRADLIDRIGFEPPGLLLVDWPGLAAEGGEWATLWSISEMRLNRLVMDAFRLATRRGWAIRVIGPLDRGEAPFFQTIESAAKIVSRDEAEALLARIGGPA